MSRATPRAEGLRAADIMSTPAIACRPGTFFEEVAELLADREISGMPVVNFDICGHGGAKSRGST